MLTPGEEQKSIQAPDMLRREGDDFRQRGNDFARGLQDLLIPRTLPTIDGLNLTASYLPKEYTGGDLYDARISDEKLLLILSDVCGKGMPAAWIASVVKLLFHNIEFKSPTPIDFLKMYNSKIFSLLPKGLYLTTLVASFDPKQLQLRFASAGYVPQILYRPNSNEVIDLLPTGTAIGLDSKRAIGEHHFQLEPNDVFFFFSDGLLRIRNKGGEPIGLDGLKTWLQGVDPASLSDANAIKSNLIQHIDEYSQDGSYDDDIALLIGTVD